MRWKSPRNIFHCVKFPLRALGLEVINAAVRGPRAEETPKAVLQKSFWIALSRCTVHIAPILVFVWVILLNYKTFYIGPGFWDDGGEQDALALAMYQVAAKLQESLCIASLATVLLQALRHDLIDSDGVPLGLMGSSQYFGDPRSLLSVEFLGAARYSFTAWKRCRLWLLVLLSSAIAAFIGPASAVLLLPRLTDFPAGGTSFSLNASTDELWPSVINTEAEIEACLSENATQFAVCPCGGYQSYFAVESYRSLETAPPGFRPNIVANGNANDAIGYNVLVKDPFNILPPLLQKGRTRGLAAETYAAQPFAASMTLPHALNGEWRIAASKVPKGVLATSSEFKWASDWSSNVQGTFPLTVVRCTSGQNISMSNDMARFPTFSSDPNSGTGRWSNGASNPVNISALDRNKTSHIRLQWIPLPIEEFLFASTGLLFELPFDRSSDSRVATACTVSASWSHGTAISGTASSNLGWYIEDDLQASMAPFRKDLAPTSPDAGSNNRYIELTPEWLRLLTPEAPDPPHTVDSWRPSTLENILYASGYDSILSSLRTERQRVYSPAHQSCDLDYLNPNMTDQETWNDMTCGKGARLEAIEFVVARLISDGLSRRMSHTLFEQQPDFRWWSPLPLPKTPDFDAAILGDRPGTNALALSDNASHAVQQTQISVRGLAYKASSKTDHFSAAVALAHMAIALAHTVWMLCSRISSSAWDSASELLLLALRSPAAGQAFPGTTAGARSLKTYAKVLTVDVTDAGETDRPSESGPTLALQTRSRTQSVSEAARLGSRSGEDPEGESRTALVGRASPPVELKPLASNVPAKPSKDPRRRKVRINEKYY